MNSIQQKIKNVAHQWRQPLSVISSISTGLKMKSEFDSLDGYDIIPDMDVITKQVQYLSKTIDDFRNFSVGFSYKGLYHDYVAVSSVDDVGIGNKLFSVSVNDSMSFDDLIIK